MPQKKPAVLPKQAADSNRASGKSRNKNRKNSSGKKAGRNKTAGISRNTNRNRKRKKINPLWLGAAAALLAVAAAWIISGFLNPLTLKSYSYKVHMTEAVDLKGNIESVFLGSADDVVVEAPEILPGVIASYNVSYHYRGNTYTFKLYCTDIKAPELEVQDVTTDTVGQVSASDFVVSRYDDTGCTLSIRSDDLNKTAGTYTVTIEAVDSYGNSTVKTASLTRVQDEEAPVLEGFQEEITLQTGSSYNPKMYSAVDNLDPSVKMNVNTSGLDLSAAGTGTVIYTLSDRSGNTSEYVQTVNVVQSQQISEKTVYLTFNDGPSAITENILQILDAYNVPATFFVTGVHPEYADLLSEIAEKGHAIGLHSYSHDYSSIYADEQSYLEDLKKISDLVQSKTGLTVTLIRFPGGSSNVISSSFSEGIMTKLAKTLTEQGYTYFDWTTDSSDRGEADMSTIIESVQSGTGLEQTVILFHDSASKLTTLDALPDIIETYQEMGYTFSVLTEDTPAVHHNIVN